MIDDMLFQRGHIMTKVSGCEIDDYDVVIADHYFKNVLGLEGEVTDANGSEYELLGLNGNDFDIQFTFDELEFSINIGPYSLTELVVKCSGTIIEVDDYDVLDIRTFEVLSAA